MLYNVTVQQKTSNFFLGPEDNIEIKLDLILSESEIVNNLDFDVEGPFKVWYPWKLDQVAYSNTDYKQQIIPVKKILDDFSIKSKMFYLYR